jgi:hypothetical protein
VVFVKGLIDFYLVRQQRMFAHAKLLSGFASGIVVLGQTLRNQAGSGLCDRCFAMLMPNPSRRDT